MATTVYTPVERSDLGVGIADIETTIMAGAAALTCQWYNSGNELFFVNNGSGAPITATLKAVPDNFGRGGSTIGDQALTVAAGKIGMFPFAAPQGYNTGGLATVEISSIATVTVGVLRVLKQT